MTEIMLRPFRLINQQEFFSTYKSSLLLSQLLFSGILGCCLPVGKDIKAEIEFDNEDDILILEELEKNFQQWEGTISKMVFQDCFHYFEGAVVTSVSTYLSPSKLQKNEDVQQFMQVFMDLVQDMPAAVEFPFFKSSGAVEVSAVAAATLLQQVIDLLDVAFPIVERESLRPQHSEGIDEDVLKLFNVRIPIRPLTPRPSINDKLSCDSAEKLKRLVEQCLILPAQLLTPPAETMFRYNLRQYFSLLAMHWSSDEVQTILAKTPSPDFLRRGIAASHPILAYIHELQRIINRDEGEAEESERETDKAIALLAQRSLAAVRRAQLLRRQARGRLEEGDVPGALHDLTTALSVHCDNPYDLEDQADDEDEDEENEEEDENDVDEENKKQRKSRGCLPRYLRTLLLAERASIYLLLAKDGDSYPLEDEEDAPLEAALRDVELAMALNDGFCPSAVALKAQLLPLLQESDGSVTEGEQARVAAETAFEAYLLGGGVDASLAASADEFARKACKDRASLLFQQKQSQVADGDEMVEKQSHVSDAASNSELPRSWMVSSYFSSYCRISTAFSIQQIRSDRPFIADSDDVDDSVDEQGCDNVAFQLLSELVRTIEDVAYLSWSPTAASKVAIESLASEDELSHYEGQLRLTDQGRLDDWLESPDGKGEVDDYEMSDSVTEQSGDGDQTTESPPCPFLMKLVSSLLSSSLTRERILPYLSPASLDSARASSLSSNPSDLLDESDSVSHHIHARLLNVSGCVLYLLGQSKAAEEAFRDSIDLDGQLEDSRIKLAAILIDMDNTEEAATILHTVSMWGGLAAAPARFQWAQLSMAQNDFKAAISHASSCVDILLPGTKKAAARGSQGAGEAEEGRRASEILAANAYAIWGMCKMKLDPNDPESARAILQKGVDQTHGGSTLLQLCLSDAACQCGDLRLAVSGYRNSTCCWQSQCCPLPYIHAARLCVQLAQFQKAKELLDVALKMDPSLASTWTEVAQLFMQRRLSCRGAGFESSSLEWGHEIENALETALSLAKHYSEIVDVLAVKLSSDIQMNFISSIGI